jgi:hypothetical protein
MKGPIQRDSRSLGGNVTLVRIGGVGFQDHRHRPLGHPSAWPFYSEMARSALNGCASETEIVRVLSVFGPFDVSGVVPKGPNCTRVG